MTTTRRRIGLGFLMVGLGAGITVGLACQCGTVPYNSNSPAAQIAASRKVVPVVGGDEYIKNNMSFSPVKVDITVSDGQRRMRAYSEVARLTSVDVDNSDTTYTIHISIGLVSADGDVYHRFTDTLGSTIDLNELCTEDRTKVPDKIVITKNWVDVVSRKKK